VVPDPLTIAVELVRNDRQVAGSRIAAAMRRHGHTVTDRTGLRWRDRAVNHLATELSRDLRDASNDEVQLAGAAV
jgi:translation initiation factor 1 (eIF-1/SUI1)